MLLEELVLPLRTDNALFKAGLAAAAAGVAALVAGMGLAIKATFKWADELDSIQDIMGGTNKTAAALNFTLRKSGTATDLLTQGMTILSKGLVKADGSLDTTGKSLKAWGINVLDANGMLKDQTTLIGDISDKYSSFSTQQEKVNFLTETFGKSGAKLIDFFDTLAAEGGIDSVAAKVERLGLAIDPNRYEQFNRNLEELKLIGLALAVGFTEKVMPVIEKFLELISDPKGIDVSRIMTWADNAVGSFVKGLGDSINNWVSSGGPEQLTESLVGWIEGIGDNETTKSKLQIAMGHLVTSIGNALREVGWDEVTTAMGEKIQELFAANQPVGENSIRDFWNGVEVAGTDRMRGAWNTMEVNGSNSIRNAFNAMELAGTTALRNALNNWEVNISTKLRDISKEFYNRALAWTSKAAEGFNAGKDRILNEIRAIVTAVNAILKKIITSFTLTFNTSIGQGGASSSSNLGGGSSGNPAGGIVRPGQLGGRDASGGAVLGGALRLVGELGPELFIPGSSGRIIPNNQLGKQQSMEIDYDRLGAIIANQVVKAMNNA